MITNPILRGFNPDPAICRKGENYYIATSTFEWFPGVQIFHSRDMKNWRLVCRPLDRVSQLDLRGVDNSGGVWAPCLSYADDLFWLIYSAVHSFNGPYKDSPNYLVTAPEITGPWSEPVYLNSSGFDPSLFHDADGSKWLLNQRWCHRQGANSFDGIVMQAYNHGVRKLVGPIYQLWEGSHLGSTEGPHLLKRNDWYYLITAEGGTGFEHAISVARSRTITGPYELHPDNPLLSARSNPDLPLQKTGHGGFVECADGSWYTTHLCARPVERRGACILGRETGLQKIEWNAVDWPVLSQGGNEPSLLVVEPELPAHPEFSPSNEGDFTEGIPDCYQSLRIPITSDWAEAIPEANALRLYGRESLHSRFEQSLLGRRITSLESDFTARVQINPVDYQHAAGIVAFYDTNKWYYLRITRDLDGICRLGLERMVDGIHSEYAKDALDWPLANACLRFDLQGRSLRAHYSEDGSLFKPIGPELDATILSDEFGKGHGFTGAFFALACQDLSGRRANATFDQVVYNAGS